MKVTEVFKTIFARFGNIKAGKFVDDESGESLNDVAKVLSQFNIELYDAQGNMADVGGILDNLAGRWKNLETVEKNALASAIAGTRQRENFIVLMDNYGEAIKYTEKAMESSGTAMEKYDAYLQSIEASQAKLKATFEEFSQTLIQKGTIKGMYDLAAVGVNILSFLTKTPMLLRTIVSLIAAIAIVKLVQQTNKFRIELGSTITNVKLYIQSLRDAELQQAALAEGMNISAAKASIWTAILAVAITIISALIANYKSLNQRVEEAKDKYDNIKSSLEQTNSALEENEKRIKELNSLPSKTYVEDEELAKLKEATIELKAQKELQEQEEASSSEALYALQEKKIYGLGTYNFNSEYASKSYNEHIKELEEQRAKLEKKVAEIFSQVKGDDLPSQEILNQAAPLEDKILDLGAKIKRLESNSAYGSGNAFNDQVKRYVSLTEQINNTTDAQERLDLISKRSELFTKENGLSDNLQLLQDQLSLVQNLSDESIEAIFGNKQAWEKKKQELQNQYEEIYKILFPENYKSTKWEEVLGMDEFEGATEKLQGWVNAGLSEEEILKKLKEAYPELIDKLKEFGIEEDEIIDQFKKQETVATEATKALEKLKEDLQSTKNAYEVLNSAIEEYNSNGSISYDTWEGLIAIGDQYLSLLIDENGQIKSNTKALQDLMKAKIEDVTLTRMETYVNNLLTAAQQGNLNEILLSTKDLKDNTNARLQNIMAIIASNPELMKNSKAILQNLSAMAQLTSSISLGSDSTKDAKDATEDWEKVLDYANTILDEQIEKLEKEQEALEKLTEEKIKAHEAEIKRLEEEKELLEEKNDEKNKEIELEKLKANLQKAKQRTMRVYYADKGWVWEQDPEAIQEAQQELDDFYTEQKIENIDKQIGAEKKKTDKLKEGLEKEIKSYEERIKKIEEYKKKWEKVPVDYENTQNAIAAKAQLGADAEKKILMGIDGKGGRLKVLEDFKTGYTKALGKVAEETEKSTKRVNTAFNGMTLNKLYEMLEQMNSMVPSGSTQKDRTYYTRRGYSGFTVETGASGQKFVKIGENQWVLQSHTILGSSGRDFKVAANTPIYSKPYASGTLSAQAGLANVDEKGNELIVPKQGRYRMMEYGDTVVPHNLSQRIFDVASNPLRFIANALNSVKTPNLMSNSSRISNASTITIGTIELPSVTNGESFIKQLQLIAANR